MVSQQRQTRTVSDALFDKCVQTVLRKDGTILICCKLGLWSCSGRDHERVKKEARHYFALYYSDGEYADMLSNIPPDLALDRQAGAEWHRWRSGETMTGEERRLYGPQEGQVR
jgi:hypothetical protein